MRGIPVVKVFQQTVASFRSFNEAIKEYAEFATAYVKLSSPPQVAQLTATNGTFALLVPADIERLCAPGRCRCMLCRRSGRR